MNKDEIIEKINREYHVFLESIKSASGGAEKIRTQGGGWTVKDLLAHVAAWEQILVRFHLGGEPFDEVIGMPGARYHVTSFDDINDHLLSVYGGWSMDEVEQFAEQTHDEMMETLHALPAEVFKEPAATIAAIGLEPYPLYEYIAANTYDHYAEHLEAIQNHDAPGARSS